MSSAYLIAIGGRAPLELEANRAFHQELIDDLNRAAADYAWSGVRFSQYGRAENYVSIEVEPGEGRLTLEGLAEFRKLQRQRREEERQVA